MTAARPQWSDVTVMEDLTIEVGRLDTTAQAIEDEARSGRHPDPRVQRHLFWAADVVRVWRDEGTQARVTGDGLDRRGALDEALWRRQIASAFLMTWRGPLGIPE